MTSSPPITDRDDALEWKRWLVLLAATTASAVLALLAFVVLLDPFSTGRMTPITRIDYTTGNRLYSTAARVRDPRFDSAIFGNSHAVPITPAALDQATGRRFVMLGIEGTWPREHFHLMRSFDRHHAAPAFVIVLDDTTCSSTLGKGYTVPRWLHEGSNLTYLAHILSPFSVRIAWRRLLVMAGAVAGERADGYDPAPWMPLGRERMQQDMRTMSQPVDAVDADAPFPYLDDLERTLAGIKPDVTVLMVFTPVYAKNLPVPGSRADVRLRACKDRLATAARARPRSSVLDLRVPGPKVADIGNFTDLTHFKGPLARDVEAAIGQRLNEMMGAAR